LEHIHKKHLNDIPPALYPKTTLYAFKFSLLLGSELPSFHTAGLSQAPKLPLRVVVEFGVSKFIFSAKHVSEGRAKWIETNETRSISLPCDVSSLPDVCIYLCRGNENNYTTISFSRIPAAKFIAETFQGSKPFWQKLQPDVSKEMSQHRGGGGLKECQYPGALLIRVRLGHDIDLKSKWINDEEAILNEKAYRMRVHIYQGLPSSLCLSLSFIFYSIHTHTHTHTHTNIRIT
jgi:hypothetical protein